MKREVVGSTGVQELHWSSTLNVVLVPYQIKTSVLFQMKTFKIISRPDTVHDNAGTVLDTPRLP